MKTIIVKTIAFVLVFALCFSLFSCGLNSYSALMLVRGATANELEVSFKSLSGSLSQKLSNSYTQDTSMSVEATLEGGEMEIYYAPASYDGEMLLCKLSGEESISLSNLGYLTNGESTMIILRVPDGVTAKGGKIRVTIDNPTR